LSVVFVAIVSLAASARADSLPVSLAGQWRFALDEKNEDARHAWFAGTLPGAIHLPGSVDEAGVVNNTEPPTRMRLYRPHQYAGVAWFQRPIEAPAASHGRHLRLLLERCHWETRVWVDHVPLGSRDTLCVPHEYDLGQLSPGPHRLTIRVDNRLKYNLGWQPLGPNLLGLGSHAVSEDTQTNWNGIVGRIELAEASPVRIAELQVYPDLAKKQVRVRVRIANATNRPVHGTVQLAVGEVGDGQCGKKEVAFSADGAEAELSAELPLGSNFKRWDEFSPALYPLAASLSVAGEPAWVDRRTVRFGMRSLAAKGTQFAVNGRPVFLRGTVNCAEFPRTGYPATDLDSWQRIFRIAKSYGLNFMRFHSWCPPEACFAAADEGGFYLLIEGPSWIGDVGKDAKRDAFLEREALRIVGAYGNHPSFCLFTLGNEAHGDFAVFDRIVGRLMREDPRHLYSGHSGEMPTPDGKGEDRGRLQQFRETSQVSGLPIRNTRVEESTDTDFGRAVRSESRPVVVHEIGAFDMFPNLAEIPKYTGVLKPRNFEMIRDELRAAGLLRFAPRYSEASGRVAVELYKAEIEAELRTPGLGGFSLLELNDYPGQTMGIVGILDVFWDSKGLVKPEQWRRFCAPVVPLLRFPKRVYTIDDTFAATAEVANYGPRDLSSVGAIWKMQDAAGKQLAAGELPATRVTTGRVTTFGRFEVSLGHLVITPAKVRVVLTLKDGSAENDWDIWIYPVSLPVKGMPAEKEWEFYFDTATGKVVPVSDLVVSRAWDAATKKALAEGRKVLLFVVPGTYEKTIPSKYFVSHWGAALAELLWHGEHGMATMGGLIQADHPVFAHFPTESYLTWPWKQILEGQGAAIWLDETPMDFLPIWQVIDDFDCNRKLGMLFEARVGRGRLLVCGFDLWHNLDSRPAARELRSSIGSYMASESFRPKDQLDIAMLDKVFVRLKAKSRKVP